MSQRHSQKPTLAETLTQDSNNLNHTFAYKDFPIERIAKDDPKLYFQFVIHKRNSTPKINHNSSFLINDRVDDHNSKKEFYFNTTFNDPFDDFLDKIKKRVELCLESHTTHDYGEKCIVSSW